MKMSVVCHVVLEQNEFFWLTWVLDLEQKNGDICMHFKHIKKLLICFFFDCWTEIPCYLTSYSSMEPFCSNWVLPWQLTAGSFQRRCSSQVIFQYTYSDCFITRFTADFGIYSCVIPQADFGLNGKKFHPPFWKS